MLINFNVTTPDGREVPFTCNDVFFDYTSYRKIFSEQDCLGLIDAIKTKSSKKVAIVYGNCQTININDFLLNHVQFTNKYFIVKIPAICNYIEEGFSFVKDEIIRGGGIQPL